MANVTGVVLLSCGSFNPVTNMHLRMFEVARDALNRSERFKVIDGIISPVNDRYSKEDLIAANHRCTMVDLALKSSDWIRCDKWESEQCEWQETLKVLKHHQSVIENTTKESVPSNSKKQKLNMANARLSHQNITVKLLCGADLLQSFTDPDVWKQQDIIEILETFGIVVITREGTDLLRFIYESDILTKYENNIFLVNEWISNDVSATSVRRALRRGESVKYLVQDEVIEYINKNSLYKPMDYGFPAIRTHRICNCHLFTVSNKILEDNGQTEQETAVSHLVREGTSKKANTKSKTKQLERMGKRK